MGCQVTLALSALYSGEQQYSLTVYSCVSPFIFSVSLSFPFVCPFPAVMMLAQQAGPLEREAEGTTFHSWPAAPLPTSLRPLPGTTLHPGQIPISINTESLG